MSEVAAVTRRDVGTTASLTSIPTLSQVPTHSWTRPTSDDSHARPTSSCQFQTLLVTVCHTSTIWTLLRVQ